MGCVRGCEGTASDAGLVSKQEGERPMASYFYGLTCAAMSVRCTGYLLMGKTLHDGEKHTSPRPCWPIPVRLPSLCGRRHVFVYLLPTMLTAFAVAAAYPSLLGARLFAAAAHSFFSIGCAYALQWGHGQYPVLYISWALVFSLWFDLGLAFEVCDELRPSKGFPLS